MKKFEMPEIEVINLVDVVVASGACKEQGEIGCTADGTPSQK